MKKSDQSVDLGRIKSSLHKMQIPYRFICHNCGYDVHGKNYPKCPKCGSTKVTNAC